MCIFSALFTSALLGVEFFFCNAVGAVRMFSVAYTSVFSMQLWSFLDLFNSDIRDGIIRQLRSLSILQIQDYRSLALRCQPDVQGRSIILWICRLGSCRSIFPSEVLGGGGWTHPAVVLVRLFAVCIHPSLGESSSSSLCIAFVLDLYCPFLFCESIRLQFCTCGILLPESKNDTLSSNDQKWTN